MRVGREQRREELRQWVRGGAEGRGALLIVEGEPGAGRTDFVRGAPGGAAALGCRVRYAAAGALGAELPLRAALDCPHPGGPDRAGARSGWSRCPRRRRTWWSGTWWGRSLDLGCGRRRGRRAATRG
ncbi:MULTISPECIES: hypothetical protein [unclassified Streptomyces]|uniref:hypothetical protein n=1 Tax=unclassified Streptomyces TaxID=2593676 RepID=UPI002E2BCCF0|nr:hypothetical protein [Streptomyces sp. NBC_00273]